MHTIATERLILRPWKETDLEPFAKMNADPKVMEFFPSTFSKEQSNSIARRYIEKMEDKGWGIWAVTAKDVSDFIGMIGLNQIEFSAPFTPAVEVAWRLDSNYWGFGYAPEGATACLEFGFNTLKLEEIVAFTYVNNFRSQKVMEKIGMHHDPEGDFDHPRIEESSPVRKQVLYRLKGNKIENPSHT